MSSDEDRSPTIHERSKSRAEADSANDVLPFANLTAPIPTSPTPPQAARWLALGTTVGGGLLGGLIGYGVGDLLGASPTMAAVAGLLGAIVAAAGVGVLANLTLQAMAEWNAVQHPEEKRDPADG